MRSIHICFICAVWALGASAKEIISPSVRDGGFESGSLSASVWELAESASEGTVPFQKTTTKSGIYALSMGTETGAGFAVYQNTGYVVKGFETLDLEFYAGARYAWDADDRITASLFITDTNLENGQRTELASFTADGFANSNPSTGNAGYGGAPFGGRVELTSLHTEVQRAVTGKQLFVSFSCSSAAGEYARVDDVVLSASPPASLGLITARR